MSNFEPVLIYLVETKFGYSHPNKNGFLSGQTAWQDNSFQFQCYLDARTHSENLPSTFKAKVIGIRIYPQVEMKQ